MHNLKIYLQISQKENGTTTHTLYLQTIKTNINRQDTNSLRHFSNNKGRFLHPNYTIHKQYNSITKKKHIFFILFYIQSVFFN